MFKFKSIKILHSFTHTIKHHKFTFYCFERNKKSKGFKIHFKLMATSLSPSMTKINQHNKIHRYGKFVSMINSSKRLNFFRFQQPIPRSLQSKKGI